MLAYLVIAGTGMATACSPKGGYHFLSFLFDGVPDPDSAMYMNRNITSDSSTYNLARLNHTPSGPVYRYHKPYSTQECTVCHDKAVKSALNQPEPGLCYSCHADYAKHFAVLHGPVAGGYCSACHSAHLSAFPGLLHRDNKELCTHCHQRQSLSFPAHEDHASVDCQLCHDPHGGSDRYLLKK